MKNKIKEEKVKLWTRQDIRSLDQLKENGVIRIKESHLREKFEDISDYILELYRWFNKEVEKIMEDLSNIVDEDTKAFDKVMIAFKLPKETDEEKTARSEAIQDGYKKAIEVPLRCAEKCLKVLELQDVFANYGNINAITDVGVGTLLAYSGLEGALFNVSINLSSIKDENYKKETEEKVNKILENGKELKEELLKIVYKRLG